MNESGWTMVFKFRKKEDAERFHDYVSDEFGFEPEEMKLSTRYSSVSLVSNVIDVFAPLSREATTKYIPESIRLYSPKG